MKFTIQSDVLAALRERRPVVALESTLIAHGLPWPDNRQTALDAEAAVRSAGAEPATIAVLAGQVHVGLAEAEINHVARSGQFTKASRRDLAPSVSRGVDAATTVSATLFIARSAGIGVLATGGLGGVHRGAQTSFDVSADLDELGRADGMVVVCSGVKSILDVPATLEALETRGVVVAGFQTDTLPAFLSPTSGLRLDVRVDSPAEAAALALAHRSLGLPGAIVVAQAVPVAESLSTEVMETTLAAALKLAEEQGITGKAITPFLLDHVHQATGGQSLRANRALIVANARLAGEIAMELHSRPPTFAKG
jgi:pseudouridylate synthase